MRFGERSLGSSKMRKQPRMEWNYNDIAKECVDPWLFT